MALVPFIVLLLVAGAGCKRAERGGPEAQGPPSVDVVLARAGSLREELEYTGTTRPTQEVTVRARTEGRLVRLAVDVGDRVRRGQELGRLDSEMLRTAVRQARPSWRAASPR
jgi:multidrug efflux pump subunit AcrA (membrane-fusion protein)